MWRRTFAEFLGSAFLAAIVIGSGIAAQRLSLELVGPIIAVGIIKVLYPDMDDTADSVVVPTAPEHAAARRQIEAEVR